MNRGIVSVVLLALSAGAYCQETSLVGACLGKPRAAYAKAFGDPSTWKKKTSQGEVTVGEYKTGSAKIEAIQTKASKIPDVVNLYFYQEPKRDWKLALKDSGLSTAGVVAKEDSKHRIHLSRIKTKSAIIVEAIYIPMSAQNPDGPELDLKLKRK